MSTEGQSPRILLVRLSALGDVIHGMPIAVAMRERFPKAFIAWAVEERAAELIDGHPAIDERFMLRRGWLRSPGTVWRLRNKLRSFRFDTAIDAQGLTKSAVVAWLSGARRRIGMDGRWGRELSRWLNNTLVPTDNLHAIERGLKLLEPLGIASPGVRFDLPESPVDRAAADGIIEQLGNTGGKGDSPVFAGAKTGTVPYVLVASGAGWPSKLWPTERYAAVAEYLGRRWNLSSILVWGNEAERERAERIAAASAGYAKLAPPVSLKVLAALARAARFAMGSDTGPLHLAAAAGAPCIGLYGPWPADKHGPFGPQHINVQKMCMNGTTHQRRHAAAKHMEAIDVESVCAACDEMMERSTKFEARNSKQIVMMKSE
jgi:lipopolysaccharide heptosyltransferase I